MKILIVSHLFDNIIENLFFFNQIRGNPEFTTYVSLLEKQANEALAKSNAIEQQRAEGVFLEVAELEKLFWQMAYEEQLQKRD